MSNEQHEQSDDDRWAVVGFFTSKKKALDAVRKGDFISILPLDEPAAESTELNVERVE